MGDQENILFQGNRFEGGAYGGPKGEMEGIGARGPLDVPEPPKTP